MTYPRFWPVLILCLLTTGCTGLLVPKEDQLLPAARYAELESYMESKIPDISTAGTSRLWYLCYAYSRVKKYNKLFPCVDQLERNIEKGDRKGNMFDLSALPHLLRAEASIEFGNYPKALEQARQAYDSVMKRDLSRIMRIHALTALALSYAMNGERENAETHAKLLEDIGTAYPFTFLKTDKLTGLARTYMALGDFQKSLVYIREDDSLAWSRSFAQAASVAILAIPAGDNIFAYNQLPKLFILNKSLYETGQITEAKAGYDQLLKQPQTQDNGDIYWMILFDRGKIAEAEGNLKEAVEFYKRAIEVIEQQRSTINTEASKIGYVGNKQAVYHRLIAALFLKGQHPEAFEYVERSKSRALVDLLASKKDFAIKATDPQQAIALVNELDALDAKALIQDSVIPSDRTTVRSARDLQVKENLRTVAPELASLVTVLPVRAGEIQSSLQPDETLLEYYYHDNDLYVFLLSRNSLQGIKLDGANLVMETRQFRSHLEDRRTMLFTELAEKLYSRVVAPIEPLVRGQHLLVVPHGVLHYLPFPALQNKGVYLIDRHSVRYLPSASVLAFLKDKQSIRSRSLLIFGNPDLGKAQYDLKYAEKETVSIAEGFPRAKILLRKDASKAAFKKLGGEFQFIHFATHGRFDPDNPMNSVLLLASDQQNDGFLSLAEVYSLRLNADLVTLSACETGLGKINNGDDVVGLARGFIYAGSNAIVASLWQVDDQATAFLMTEFYTNLRKTNKQEALRNAQLAARKQFEHPFYWAAFQLTGKSD